MEALEATAKRWEKAIKRVLKAEEGVPMKLKKLVKRVTAELEGEAEAPTKASVEAACGTIKKVTVLDGLCWYGNKSSDEPAEEHSPKQEKKKKRKAEAEEDDDNNDDGGDEDEGEGKKSTMKKKKKKKKKEKDADEEESSPLPADANNTGGWNNWGAADLGDDTRKNKFLRLMGGAKPAGDGDGKKPKGGLFGSLKPSAKPQNDAISNAAAVTADLESQYSKAFNMKQQGIRGLGFEAAPKKNAWQGSKKTW